MRAIMMAVLVVLAGACDPMPQQGPEDGAPSTGGAVDAKRPAPHWRWCVQALGDGGADALGPGSRCDEARGDRCALPTDCSFESANYGSRCEAVEGEARCCQYATTHNQVTGALERCRDCGDGMICGPID